MCSKEAMVFVVRCGDDTRCAKVCKEATQRSFRQAVDDTGNRKVKNSRQARAMAKGTRYGRESQEAAWQSAEVDALYRRAVGAKPMREVDQGSDMPLQYQRRRRPALVSRAGRCSSGCIQCRYSSGPAPPSDSISSTRLIPLRPSAALPGARTRRLARAAPCGISLGPGLGASSGQAVTGQGLFPAPDEAPQSHLFLTHHDRADPASMPDCCLDPNASRQTCAILMTSRP
ncbi:MAG: hypothetical protein WCJ87_08055 [Burkholderiales bacterium]